MKEIILFYLLIMNTALLMAQPEGTEVKLDLLKAPSSPASNLLGFASSDIEKPTDVSAFMLSLQSATSSFTKLPTNYAIDIAPYWLLSKKTDYTTTGLAKNDFNNVFKQSFIISLGIKNVDSTDQGFNSTSTYGGIGFKFSIIRGSYDDATVKTLNKIGAIQFKINHSLSSTIHNWIENDPEYKALNKTRDSLLASSDDKAATMLTTEYTNVESSITKLQQDFTNAEFAKLDIKELKEIASKFTLNRKGWSWDIAGGISAEFINKRFDSSKVNNAGLWTTFGYTGTKGGSFLGILRYLNNPDKIFAKGNIVNNVGNISTLDFGIRYVYSNLKSKFNCSVEGLYRSILSSKTIDPTWRLILNADYSLWPNQKLTFSFGRNFDGTISKAGNLIAALTFLTGFGNKR